MHTARKIQMEHLPKKLPRVDEGGSLYLDDGIFAWKLADDFSEDAHGGYPRWKVVLGRMLGRGKR